MKKFTSLLCLLLVIVSACSSNSSKKITQISRVHYLLASDYIYDRKQFNDEYLKTLSERVVKEAEVSFSTKEISAEDLDFLKKMAIQIEAMADTVELDANGYLVNLEELEEGLNKLGHLYENYNGVKVPTRAVKKTEAKETK